MLYAVAIDQIRRERGGFLLTVRPLLLTRGQHAVSRWRLTLDL